MKTPIRPRTIALDKLILSPANMRQTPPSGAADAELLASIRTKGLKTNLVVCPTGEDGVWAVVAGGRRLKALRTLAVTGEIAADHPVLCMIEDVERGAETSLAENTVRLAASPVDEFVAFAALVDAGSSVEDVAARFGVSQRRVEQRLRLGRLAPDLIAAHRAGEIGLEILMAFTVSADHDAQLAAWRTLKIGSYVSPHSVRRLLTESHVPLDSAIGRFVGLEAYEAVGGTVARDLFSEADEGVHLEDTALVRRLAEEKLEAAAVALEPEWKWTKAVLEPNYGFLQGFDRVHPQRVAPPAAIVEELEHLNARADELDEMNEDAVTDALIEEAERNEERHDQIHDEIDRAQVYAAEDRATAGCIVSLDHEGKLVIHKGLVERVARTQEASASNVRSSPTRTSEEWSQPAPALSPAETLCKANGFSQAMVADLTAHRLQITQAHLTGDFSVAFDLMLYTLCRDLLSVSMSSRPLDVRAVSTHVHSTLNDLSDTPAARLLEAQRAGLDLTWTSLPRGQDFGALSALPPAAKEALFSWCVAQCLKGQMAFEDYADPVIEAAGARLGVSFAELWRPTAQNYWSRAKKAHGLAVGGEVLGERWTHEHGKSGKGEIAASLEAVFSGLDAENGRDGATRARAGAWLPPGMAYEPPNADASADAPAVVDDEDDHTDGEFTVNADDDEEANEGGAENDEAWEDDPYATDERVASRDDDLPAFLLN